MVKKILQFTSLFLVVLLLSACNDKELYQDLTELDAHEIIVLLDENGIEAVKQKVIRQNEVFYTVTVKPDVLARARSILVKNSLPRRKELGLPGVYKETGMIPTPDEQKARFLLAIKGEIINSLEKIPEIIDADVVLNVPTQNEFSSEEEKFRRRPTASVVIRAKSKLTGVAAVTEAKIQQFVSNGVEGLNPRDVTVLISYVQSEQGETKPGDVLTFGSQESKLPPALPPMELATDEQILGLNLDEDSKEKLRIYLLLFFLLLILLSTGLIVAIVQGSRMRRQVQSMQEGGQPALEGKVVDDQLSLGGGDDSGTGV